jgi:hypothetical protein
VQEPTAAVAIAHATAPPAITIIRLCLNVKYAANGDAKAWTRARMKVKVPRADGDTPKAFPTSYSQKYAQISSTPTCMVMTSYHNIPC